MQRSNVCGTGNALREIRVSHLFGDITGSKKSTEVAEEPKFSEEAIVVASKLYICRKSRAEVHDRLFSSAINRVIKETKEIKERDS